MALMTVEKPQLSYNMVEVVKLGNTCKETMLIHK